MRIATTIFLVLLTACGGPPPPDEVTEAWTAGDDAALEEGGEPSEPSDASE